ncbi:response regulator [Roseivirga sp.]|uniref:response regulator n=1 Tax=Roseivirga sp. TaxID=1964215 RepID=UPI003B8E426F
MGAKSYFLVDNKIQPMDEEFNEEVSKVETVANQVLEGISILIIDDNPINLIVAEKTLRKFGAKSIKALSAKEGIQKYNASQPSLILMDLHMPGIDGFQGTALVRETEKFQKNSIPILAYTTYAYDEVKAKIEEHNLDGYIGKPFTQGQVFETIMSVLSIKSDSKQA